MSDKIVLYSYWRSSCSWRVRIALALKGIEYEYEAVNLLQGKQKSGEYVSMNPTGQVPTLLIDGHHLTQSLAIMEYLDETRPDQGSPLLPRNDPLLRSLARQVSHVIASGTQPLQNLTVLNKIGQDYGESEKKKWAQHWITVGLEAAEKIVQKSSKDGKFCVGDSVTIADLCLIPQLYNARRFDVDLSLYPTLLSIEEHCSSLSTFKEAHPDAQPDAVQQ